MIAGCIERIRHDDCGGCERRDACASLWRALGLGLPRRRHNDMPQGRPAPRPSPFLGFLGEVAKAIEGKAAETKAKRQGAFRTEVERRVEPLLASGTIRIDAIARQMGCSRQTLYRRLKAEGVTFAQLLDGVRRRLALRFVRDEGLSVKESAYRLGFSDPAAFSRAFKRWTGSSPRAKRN